MPPMPTLPTTWTPEVWLAFFAFMTFLITQLVGFWKTRSSQKRIEKDLKVNTSNQHYLSEKIDTNATKQTEETKKAVKVAVEAVVAGMKPPADLTINIGGVKDVTAHSDVGFQPTGDSKLAGS